MIGLQVLHLATSVAAAQSGDVLTMMSWLNAHGHRTALAAGGSGELPGVEVIHYRAKAPAWWLGGKQDLLSHAAAWNPDLIHLHGAVALPAARAIARRLNLPVVVSVDADITADQARGLRDPTVAWVLVQSEVHRAHFVGRLRLDRDQVCVLPFAIDAVRSAACPPRPGNGELVVGMMAGDLASCERLLAAVARLNGDGVKASALIGWCAEQEAGPELAALAARAGGAPLCTVMAVRQPAELIACCDALVLPVERDAPAGALIQAMACGRPVVASAVGGLTELIRDGHTGLLVPPGDIGALSSALQRLAGSQELRRSLCVSAAAQVCQRFDFNVVGPATLELYHAAISARQNASAKAEGNRAYQRRVSDLQLP
jgi:glycosyltransferase involved in cell wall biosynthesis